MIKLLTVRCAFAVSAAVLFGGFFLSVQSQALGGFTRLLRTPAVSANQIAFAYANNIWTVLRAGGSARRLTSFQGQTVNPHFSPDGKWIAFSGEYAGNLDLYVVAADAGEPRRLTWHPGAPATANGPWKMKALDRTSMLRTGRRK